MRLTPFVWCMFICKLDFTRISFDLLYNTIPFPFDEISFGNNCPLWALKYLFAIKKNNCAKIVSGVRDWLKKIVWKQFRRHQELTEHHLRLKMAPLMEEKCTILQGKCFNIINTISFVPNINLTLVNSPPPL